MKKTTFAIVGTGVVGERIINQLRANEAASIIALFDENTERLKEIAHTYDLHVASSYEELLSLKPDWVYVGTPPNSHERLSQKAMAKGMNVLCEKPLAHNVDAGAEMALAAVNEPIQTAMHFPLMYSPSVRHMMKLVEQGTIGKIVRVELSAYFPNWPRLWQQNPWIDSREQGGFTREVFTHYVQLMYRMFGGLSIESHQTIYPEDELFAETGLLAFGTTANGIPFLLNGVSNIGQQEELSYTVYGANGVLKLRNWSELSIALKDSPFEILTSFDSVETVVDACIAVTNGDEGLIVPFGEGFEVQKLIDQLLE